MEGIEDADDVRTARQALVDELDEFLDARRDLLDLQVRSRHGRDDLLGPEW